MTPGELWALVTRHRISLDAATRVVSTERGEVDVLIWIARRHGEACSKEAAEDAVLELERRQGLLPREGRG